MSRPARETITLWALTGCLAMFFSMWLPWFHAAPRDLAGVLELIAPGNEEEMLQEALAMVGGQAPISGKVKMGILWPVPVFLLCAVGAGVLVLFRVSGWFRPAVWWISGFFLLGASGVAAWCIYSAKAGCQWHYGGGIALAGGILVLAAWVRFHFPRPDRKDWRGGKCP